ncbi:MAG: GNAT family N-acetyltransferase [Thermoplasmata archaeon]|nr:MAG: GNAT family N-acetyltransferase [Thermoplasmata archaeon]
MKIVKAEKKDYDNVLDLVSDIIKDMEIKGNPQWDESYPIKEVLFHDIEDGTLFVMEEKGEFIALCALTENEEPQYVGINWMDKNTKALEIHRIAVHPDWQKKGIARKLFDFAEEYAHKNRHSSMRLDTYCKNLRMIKIIEQRGYIRTGEIFFPPLTRPFYCYEKIFG